LLSLLGKGVVAAASGSSVVGLTGQLISWHQAKEQRTRDTREAIDFLGFRSDINSTKFEEAVCKAQKASSVLRKNSTGGEHLIWEFNSRLCDALRGIPNSVTDLRAILQVALPFRSSDVRFADWHYLATCDLFYFDMLFFDRHPQNASSAFEKEAYWRLESGGLSSLQSLVELNAYCFHVFELSPSLTISNLTAPQYFLRSKLSSLKGDYVTADRHLRACQEINLDANDGGLAIDLARSFVLSSLGDDKGACAQAAKASEKISNVESETRKVHLQTVPALFTGTEADLVEQLKRQSQKACRRGITWDIFRSDNANFLGGQPATYARRKYAQAGLNLLDKSDPDNLARITSLCKSAA